MGIRSWFPRWGGRKSADPDGRLALFRDLFSWPAAKSGQTVNWKTALRVSAVLACVRVKQNGVSQVPLKILKPRPDRGADPVPEHMAYRLLNAAPNDWQTAYEYFQQVILHLELTGNHFSFKNMVRGELYELLPLEPGWVTVKQNPDWSLTYKVAFPGRSPVEIPASQIWHVRGMSWSGWMGMEPVRLAREAIGLALAAEEHVARTLSQGGNVNGVLQHKGTGELTPEQIKLLRQQWEEVYGGPANAGKTVILKEMEFKDISMKLIDAEMMAERKFEIEEIARFAGVFPTMIGYSDKTATYASAESFFSAHVVHCLQPLYRMLEQSINKNLLGLDSGVYAKFNANALLRGLAKDRAEFYTKMVAIRAMFPNEVRDFEDMNPYEGGDEFPPMQGTPTAENPPADPDKPEEE